MVLWCLLFSKVVFSLGFIMSSKMVSYINFIIVLLTLVSVNEGKIYFQEGFESEDWESQWIQSKHSDGYGKFVLTAGKFYGDSEKSKGIQTSQDAKFYALSRKFEPFSSEGKTLVIQFTAKHEQNIDCGGGYIKLFGEDIDLTDIHGETPYHIMFGPDICGPSTKKVHVIFAYKGKNHLLKRDIRCKDDEATHIYTLIVKPDNTYEVLIDNEKAQSGALEDDWDFLPPKKIKDPEAKKPEDWDDREKIDDPEDSKPEDWDKTEHIADPEAKKPDDWDDEMDGEWEPPMIDNPDYKGEWKPKQIDNPDYKGHWVHPEIDNPEYTPDDKLYKYDGINSIAFDLWQVKSGTIFDNILITDDPSAADVNAKEILERVGEEKKMKEKFDEEDRQKAEEEEKNAKKDESDEEDDEDADDNEEPEPEGLGETTDELDHDHDEL